MKITTPLLTTALTLGLGAPAWAADCTIKVGVLHSLSGTMAISETTLKDTMEMLVDQQNAKGGVIGCDLETVVVDPASDWPLFAEKARELLTVHEVDVIFGNWTSVSRKSVLSSPIRRRGKLPECLLHRGRPEPAGDSGNRLFP